MINYNFHHAFAPDLRTGALTLSLRRPRKPPGVHAQVGDVATHWTGLNTPDATRQAVGLVTLRALVRFQRTGIVGVHDVRFAAEDRSIEPLHAALSQCANDQIARCAGFVNWDSLWLWQAENLTAKAKADHRREFGHAFGEHKGDTLTREAIAWRPFTADQIAELDTGRARLEQVA